MTAGTAPGPGHLARAMLLYGVLGFGAGFCMGALREMVMIPAFGESAGRWLEFIPLLGIIIAIGWSVTRRFAPATSAGALLLGLGGICVLLLLESAFALLVLGIPLTAYLEGFDITAGALFPFGLAVMLAVPPLACLLGDFPSQNSGRNSGRKPGQSKN